jgi:hypothetical protein
LGKPRTFVSSAPATANVASCNRPTKPSICSDPKSASKNCDVSTKLCSFKPSFPEASYFFRKVWSDNTWYASPIFWNFYDKKESVSRS